MREPKWYAALPRWARKVVDQVIHAIAGAAISGLVGGLCTLGLDGGWAGLIGASSSVLAAVIRELAQNLGDRSNDALDAVVDAAVWSVAGIATGLVIWGVA